MDYGANPDQMNTNEYNQASGEPNTPLSLALEEELNAVNPLLFTLSFV